jgi:hypothetical protein
MVAINSGVKEVRINLEGLKGLKGKPTGAQGASGSAGKKLVAEGAKGKGQLHMDSVTLSGATLALLSGSNKNDGKVDGDGQGKGKGSNKEEREPEEQLLADKNGTIIPAGQQNYSYNQDMNLFLQAYLEGLREICNTLAKVCGIQDASKLTEEELAKKIEEVKDEEKKDLMRKIMDKLKDARAVKAKIEDLGGQIVSLLKQAENNPGKKNVQAAISNLIGKLSAHIGALEGLSRSTKTLIINSDLSNSDKAQLSTSSIDRALRNSRRVFRKIKGRYGMLEALGIIK